MFFTAGRRIIVLILSLITATANALPAWQTLTQMHRQTWSSKDGLLGNVLAIAQTKDGYLWVGTDAGLYRFDGQRFEIYRSLSGKLSGVRVVGLFGDDDGSLWVGYINGGVSRLFRDAATNFVEQQGIPHGNVTSFASDLDGNVWMASGFGLSRYSGGHMHLIGTPEGLTFSASLVQLDSAGTLWATGVGETAYLLHGETHFHVIPQHTSDVTSFVEQKDRMGLMMSQAQRMLWVPLPRASTGKRRFNSTTLNTVVDRDGTFWLANYTEALYRATDVRQLEQFTVSGPKHNPGLQRFGAKDSSNGWNAWFGLEDMDGNIWIGAGSELDRFRQRNVQTEQPPEGMGSIFVTERNRGEIWVAPQSPVPAAYATWKRLSDGKALPIVLPPLTASMRAKDGSTWFATVQAASRPSEPAIGLWHWDAGLPKQVPTPAQWGNHYIVSIVIDERHWLYASVSGLGEWYFDGSHWHQVPIPPASPLGTNAQFVDDKGNVWWLYHDQLVCLREGKVISQITLPKDSGRSTAVGGTNGVVLIGGEEGVAAQINGQLYRVVSAEGDRVTPVTSILSSTTSGVWLPSPVGLTHLSPDALKSLRLHPYAPISTESFTEVSDGWKASGGIMHRFESSDGRLWFSGGGDLLSVSPERIQHPAIAPTVHVNSITTNGVTHTAPRDLTLPPGTRTVQASFIGLNLSAPEKVRYRYRLVGSGADWSPITTENTAVLPDLRPGHYQLQVIAQNGDGVWSNPGDLLSFTIRPTFYETWYFELLCLLAAFSLLYSAYRIRLRRALKDIALQIDAQTNERTRIARDLHDSFFSAIQGVLLQVSLVTKRMPEDDAQRAVLERALDYSDVAMKEGRDLIFSLRVSVTNLEEELAKHAKHLNELHPIPYMIDVHGKAYPLPPSLCRELLEIGKECLTNAYRHSKALQVSVSLVYRDRECLLTVSDNGIGIAPRILEHGRDGHWGLSGLKERVRLLEGHLSISSNPREGTTITVSVPKSNIHRFSARDVHPVDSTA